MKCPNCGGEVPSQSIECPYCGSINPEGVAFSQEIQKKIERNKLLKPFLIKQKKPELVQRMLTRILLILVGVNVLLFVFAMGISVWSYHEVVRVPVSGSKAEQYETVFGMCQEFYCNEFLRDMNEFIDAMEAGQIPEQREIGYILDSAYRALLYTQDEDERLRQELIDTMQAFFLGYLGLSEEEISCLAPDENGTYDSYLDRAEAERNAVMIEQKLQEVAE